MRLLIIFTLFILYKLMNEGVANFEMKQVNYLYTNTGKVFISKGIIVEKCCGNIDIKYLERVRMCYKNR